MSEQKETPESVRAQFSDFFGEAPSWLKTPSRVAGLLFALSAVVFLSASLFAPAGFPAGEIVRIENGATLNDTAKFLKEKKIIKSEILFDGLVILRRGEKGILAGDYFFPEKTSLFGVVAEMTDKGRRPGDVKITVPEGLSVQQMSPIYDAALPNFDGEEFIKKATSLEGYLFPDTYFFRPGDNEDVVISKMRQNFDGKMAMAEKEIKISGKNLKDLVIIASILELEAKTSESRRIISGILWKRIAAGMPLQVDASFLYINGKKTGELSLDDLALDSPYNTYKHAGLPPGPISNPGLDAILAAANPRKSNYLFYLSDSEGVMHYARNFEEHKANKALYLGK